MRIGFVAEEEVAGERIVEVHWLFDQPKANHTSIEIHVHLGVTADPGDMVDPW